MPFAIALHILAAVIWVGGMFFAYMALRPVAASLLEPPLRLPLWSQTFARFFPWVWAAVVALPLTGYWMILVPFEGFANAGGHIHLMQVTGWAMIAIFSAHILRALSPAPAGRRGTELAGGREAARAHPEIGRHQPDSWNCHGGGRHRRRLPRRLPGEPHKD